MKRNRIRFIDFVHTRFTKDFSYKGYYSKRIGWYGLRNAIKTFPAKSVKPGPKGGETLVLLTIEDPNTIIGSISSCSKKDNFRYSKGNGLSLLRALEQAVKYYDLEMRVVYTADSIKLVFPKVTKTKTSDVKKKIRNNLQLGFDFITGVDAS